MGKIEPNKVKVLMIETGGWGGVCHYTYNLANALVSQNNYSIILLTSKTYELKHYYRKFELHPVFDSKKSYFSNLHTLWHEIQLIKPDVLHVQTLFSPRRDWLCLWFAKLINYPIVYTVHNILPHDEFEREALGLKICFKLIYNSCDRLILHSSSYKEDFLKNFTINDKKVAIIPHGHYLFFRNNQQQDQSQARISLGLETGSKVVLFFGLIRPYKGIEFLINAFKKVREEIAGAILVIAGKTRPEWEQYYKALVQKSGLNESVRLEARYIPIDEVGTYFIAADVVVFPYLNIYQSGSLQLAYAFEKPVVVTDVGALKETVEEGKNGLVVQSRDSESLSKALIELLIKPANELKEMGAHSKYLAETRFNWDIIAKDTSKIYGQLI